MFSFYYLSRNETIRNKTRPALSSVGSEQEAYGTNNTHDNTTTATQLDPRVPMASISRGDPDNAGNSNGISSGSGSGSIVVTVGSSFGGISTHGGGASGSYSSATPITPSPGTPTSVTSSTRGGSNGHAETTATTREVIPGGGDGGLTPSLGHGSTWSAESGASTTMKRPAFLNRGVSLSGEAFARTAGGGGAGRMGVGGEMGVEGEMGSREEDWGGGGSTSSRPGSVSGKDKGGFRLDSQQVGLISDFKILKFVAAHHS